MAPEQVSVTVAFKGAAKEAGKGLRVFKTGLLAISLIARPRQIYRQKRELPLLLAFAGHEETRLSLELPEGLKPAYFPGQLRASAPSGTATREWSFEGNKLQMKLDVDIPGRIVKPEDYPAFRNLYASLAAESARSVLLEEGR